MKLIFRALVLLTLIILCNPAVYAKQRLQLGLTGGLSTAYLKNPISVYTLPKESFYGYHAGIKGLVDFRALQLGVGVEVGKITGDFGRYVDDSYLKFIGDYYYYNNGSILGFYKAPHLLVNLKINVGNALYFFGGGVGGLIMGESDMTLSKYTSPFYGANVGVVVNLGSFLGLEIYEGWRHTDVYRNVPIEEIDPYYKRNLRNITNLNGATINYFTTNIGLRIRFGSNENKWYR